MIDRALDRCLARWVTDERRRDARVARVMKVLAFLCLAGLVALIALMPGRDQYRPASAEDPVERATQTIKSHYEALSRARQAQDAEGMAHFLSPNSGLVASDSREPWREALFRYCEEGSRPGAFFMEGDSDPIFTPWSKNMRDTRVPDEMNVRWQYEDSSAYAIKDDQWTRDGSDWRLRTNSTVTEFSKAYGETQVASAYRSIDVASDSEAVAAASHVWSDDYRFISLTGVLVPAGEAKDNLRIFLKRHKWRDRRITVVSREFQRDRSYAVVRSIAVPLGNSKESVTVYEDTWAPVGVSGKWLLVKTRALQSTVQRSGSGSRGSVSVPAELPDSAARAEIEAAYREMDEASAVHDAERVLRHFAEDVKVTQPSGEVMRYADMREAIAREAQDSSDGKAVANVDVFTLGGPDQSVVLRRVVLGASVLGWMCDVWNRREGRWLVGHRYIVDPPTTPRTPSATPWVSEPLRQDDIDAKSAAAIQTMIRDIYSAAGSEESFTPVQTANINVLVARRRLLRGH